MGDIRPVEIESSKLEGILGAAFAPVVTISELIKNSSDACLVKKDTIRVVIDTTNRTIIIKDNGNGISMEELDNLRRPGRSSKMTQGNLLSSIDEPYAGSKGLGILTAFSLCSRLEIKTFSQTDKQAYIFGWHKGSAQIEIILVDEQFIGTEVTLYGVNDEDIDLLIDSDELQKLFISSITYYRDSESLPIIEFFVDGEDVTVYPLEKIESLYEKYKKRKNPGRGYFVSKATFRYSNNNLILSYEDNEKALFGFTKESINLTDFESVKSFIYKYNIEFRNLKTVWEKLNKKVAVDDFEGCYYIWRDRKEDDLEKYPYGVRIYVNNYGLYRYLNSDDDWLQHTEISQNVRNTNFKLRNTYGYVSFYNYNEYDSGLIISNDRNDFKVNQAQKKFMYIMRHFVSGIFSYIDIAMRNYVPESPQFKCKYAKRNIHIGDSISIYDLISTQVPIGQIQIITDENTIINQDDLTLCVNKVGIHKVIFKYNELELSVELDAKDPTPRFKLIKEKIRKTEGSSIELSQYINQSSIVGFSISDIKISSEDSNIKNNYFTKENYPGAHLIDYSYKDEGYDITQKLQIILDPLRIKESKKIKELFPLHNKLIEYFKIKDVIKEISESYTQNPTICMISIRTLIEISLKAFEEKIFNVEVDNTANYSIEQKFKWIHDEICNDNTIIDKLLIDKYRAKLTTRYKKTINYYKRLSLNIYIHEHDSIATPNEVYAAVRRFSLILNFIIEALVLKQSDTTNETCY